MLKYLKSRTTWAVIAAAVFYGAQYYTGDMPDAAQVDHYLGIAAQVATILALIFARFKKANV